MTIATYLVKSRQNRYYFRIIVPKDVRAAVGQKEVRRSVKTRDPIVAAARAAQLAYSWIQNFENLRAVDPNNMFNNLLMKDAIILKNFKAGNVSADEIILETDEDAASFKKLIDGNSGDIADKPISELIAKYLEDNKQKWKPAVYKEYKALYRQAVELIGDIPVRAITRQRAKKFKETLIAVRQRGGKPLSRSAINKTLGKMSSVWIYGNVERLGIPDKYNPWVGLQLREEEAESDQQPAYSAADLQLLFSADYGSKGAINGRPARYWLPLLSLYHGFRIGEPAQLTIDDIITEDSTCCIQLTSKMELKNKNARRKVPIHPVILDLGFLDFVQWRKDNITRTKSEDRRLFIDLSDKGARKGSAVSAWWNNRYASKFKLTEDTSLHSLRHSCITLMRASPAKSTHIAEIQGHKRGETQSDTRYGKTVVRPLLEALSSVQYQINPPKWSDIGIKHIKISRSRTKS